MRPTLTEELLETIGSLLVFACVIAIATAPYTVPVLPLLYSVGLQIFGILTVPSQSAPDPLHVLGLFSLLLLVALIVARRLIEY